MTQMATIATGRKARCAMAGCQFKRVSLMHSMLKRCSLCDACRPFEKMLKCSVCKIAFHLFCATRKVKCNREPADESHAPAGVCVDDVRENFPANLDTTTTVTAADVNRRERVTEDATEVQVENVTEAQVEYATDAQVEYAIEAQAEYAMEAQAEDATEVHVENVTEAQAVDATEVQAKDTTEMQAKDATEVQVENVTEAQAEYVMEAQAEDATEVHVENVTEAQAVDATEVQAKDTTEMQAKDATEVQAKDATEAQAEGNTVSPEQSLTIENFPANLDTITTATAADVNRREHVAEDATEAQAVDATEVQAKDSTEMQAEDATEVHVENVTEAQAEGDAGSPEQILPIESAPVTECSRNERIAWSEYFEYLANNTSEDEKARLKEAIARASRPSPVFVVRSSFTRNDYLELSAAWDEVTLRKSSRRSKPFRIVVHSMTVRNTAHHGLKRVRFGRDPSLMSDR